MSLDSLLSQDTVTVKAPTKSRDSSGGAALTFADLYTGVPARVNVLDAHQREIFAMKQIEATHAVYTAQAGIKNGHAVVTSDNVFVRVTGVVPYRGIGGLATYYKVLGVEVKPQ
jgi:hypothetical protein